MKSAVRAATLALSLCASACSESVDEHGMTELMRAAHDGDAPKVTELIDERSDVNRKVPPYPLGQRLRGIFFLGVPDRDVGWTALMYALSEGNDDIARRLLDAGADPNLAGRSGLRALGLVVMRGDTALLRQLLDRGAEPYDAALVGARSVELTRILLEAGGNPNARHMGATPLLLAAGNGDVSTVRLLLEHGADVDLRHTDTGASALQLATRRGSDEIANLLRNAGADTTGLREDALFDAILAPESERFREDLAGGGNPNARDDTGTPLLVIAAQRGLTEIVEALLGAGADPSATDRIVGSALTMAAAHGHLDVIERLIEAGAPVRSDERAFVMACNAGELVVVRTLLDAGASVDAGGGEAPRIAVRSERPSVVRELIARGADVALTDHIGMTALMRATGSVELTEILLEAGAPVNVQDDMGTTALIFAAAVGNADVVRLLLDAGADLRTRNDNGSTALGEAHRMRHAEIADLLERAR